MHIGFVTTESPYGDAAACGIAAYLRALIPAVVGAGHRVSVFAGSKQDEEFYAEEDQVKVHHFRLPSWHWYASKIPGVRRVAPLPLRQLEWSLAFYRQVARVAAREKIDVLEGTETGTLFLKRIAPVVIRLHGSEYLFRMHARAQLDASVRWNDSLEANSARRAIAITTPSQFQADEVSRHRGYPRNRIQVIPNPVSAKILRAAEECSGTVSEERIVLYTGRLAPVKGIETLLAAAKSAQRQNSAVTFVLAGPWQMPQPPAAYGLELNQKNADGVLWVGPQDQTQLINWYRRARLFVMPSYYESFGISVVEAMAFNLPVIASDIGGLREVMGSHGCLVAKGDSAALAEAIIGCLSQRKEFAPQENFRSAIVRFRPEEIARETLALYDAVRREFAADPAGALVGSTEFGSRGA